ncbi:odorant receptor 49b isoform X2 [Harpegnathos saltator]|uniref:odorant receptor 49b isoform X2 n=1 Tax=Harpegnathos saltator TaxID=610380 RepID=UPI000DBEE03D|nr:odorant receptor 49b isoform X2 [Harpegnathos saltator]
MVKVAIFICPTTHVICNIVVYRIIWHRLQSITFEMENFYKLIKPHEETILQKYINKCVIFYGGSIIGIYLISIIIISGPVTLNQPFPIMAEYPFDVFHQPMRTIAYIHQSICILQASAHICINTYTTLLLWFSSARLELLTDNLHAIRNIYDLTKCVQEHQKLLKYAEQVIRAIRPFAFIVMCFSTLGLIIVGLIFVTDQPLSMKIQCAGIAFNGLSEVFMYTWPAEHLIHVNNKIEKAIYSVEWYEHSVELQRSIQIILMRAQKPLLITIPCVMPPLSLNYYTKVLYKVFVDHILLFHGATNIYAN